LKRVFATLPNLPKYSPDLNPIEMPFSKLKADLRKGAERTIPRLRRRIGRFAHTLTAREASNYFRHQAMHEIVWNLLYV
jgi:transposase